MCIWAASFAEEDHVVGDDWQLRDSFFTDRVLGAFAGCCLFTQYNAKRYIMVYVQCVLCSHQSELSLLRRTPECLWPEGTVPADTVTVVPPLSLWLSLSTVHKRHPLFTSQYILSFLCLHGTDLCTLVMLSMWDTAAHAAQESTRSCLWIFQLLCSATIPMGFLSNSHRI